MDKMNLNINKYQLRQDDVLLQKYNNVLTESEKDYNKYKCHLEKFKDIKFLSEAKSFAKEVFGIKNEINYIKTDNAQLIIVQRANMLRVILDSDKEFICYNYTLKKEKAG